MSMASESGVSYVGSSKPVTFASFWSDVRGYPLRAFLICLIGVSLANMDQALFAYVLTEIMHEFNWSVVERGWYIALTFTIAGASIAAVGVLTDRVGRKRIFQASIIISAFFVTALRWAPNTLWLVTLRTLGFATGGVQSPVTGTIVVEESPPRYRGLLSGVLQIGYPVGWYMASQFAAPIYTHYGWRQIFFIALISIPYAWVVRKYLKETKSFLKARAASTASGKKARFADLFSRELRLKTVVLFLGEFLHVFAYGATILLTAYFREARGWPAADAINLVGYTFGVGALGYILAAIVGEFFITRRNTIIIWSWLGTAAFALMIWTTNSWWAITISYCLMTIFFYGTTAVKFTFIAENFPARVRATGVSFSGSLAVNLGVAFGPLALSYVVRSFGWNWAFTICGIIPLFLSGVVFLALKPIPLGAAVEEATA
ncbi:MAG: MFS transporter [Acidobacteria bacterium]|nr:MFS transporter [Acidobacteriota bacterium]